MRLTAFLGAMCTAASVQFACAADLVTKAPMYPQAPAILYSWTGFYVGGNIGYGWDNIDDTTNSLTGDFPQSTISGKANGVFGGGQVGYNYIFNPSFLIGVEADLDAADLSGSHSECIQPSRCAQTNNKIHWFDTVRGRIGYVQSNLLLFVTGGVALVHTSTNRTLTAALIPAALGQSVRVSNTDVGWTVGGGVEYGFAPRWSVNLEYRYIQFDTGRDFIFTVPAANVHVDSTDHINTVRIGLNYHFN